MPCASRIPVEFCQIPKILTMFQDTMEKATASHFHEDFINSNDIPVIPTQEGAGMASASSKSSVSIPMTLTVQSRPDSIYFPGGRVLTTQVLF